MASKAAQSSRKTGSRKKATSRKKVSSKKTAAKTGVTRSSVVGSGGESSEPGRLSSLFRRRQVKTPLEAEISSNAFAIFKRGLREAAAILIAVVAILMLISLVTFQVSDPGWSHTGGNGQVKNAGGVFGAWFADISMFLFGYIAYVLPFVVGLLSWNAFKKNRDGAGEPILVFARVAGVMLLLITACGLSDLHVFVQRGDLPIGTAGGGVLGAWVASSMVNVVSALGATLILLALLLGAITFVTGSSWFTIMEGIGRGILRGISFVRIEFVKLQTRVSDYFSMREARREHALVLARENAGGQDPASGNGVKVGPVPLSLEPQLDTSEPDPTTRPAVVAATAAAATTAVAAAKSAAANLSPIAIKPRPVTPAPVTPTEKSSEKQFHLFDKKAETSKRKPGEMPPVSLLDAIENARTGYSKESLEQLSRLLETKLADFNVEVKVVEVHPGPVVTRFEVQLAAGLKVSKLTSLSKDIARSLSVMSVRVVEVIAGKSTVGLEIPNEDRELVQLTEILQSEKYRDNKSPLVIALGKDISGLPVTADIAKMPHLLVAGTTGAGKSVAVNALLISLLYKATADQVRLILIDPKMLELNVYEGIPHLLTPVVTDMKEAANALRWCVGEMERRYRLMSSLGVRNIAGYNTKILAAREAGEPILDPLYKPEEALDPSAPVPELDTMPFIVVVVDEFADMMMVVGKKVEELIARIAQKARAAGIHLVLATQRPSVDVITGLIKANIPTRMAFRVSSRIDSRTILDQGGAETLLGHGDMLYLPPGKAHPQRVHGAFVDDHEVHSVVDWLRESGSSNYVDEILNETTLPLPGMASDDTGDGERDELYDKAVAVVTETRKASISYVQRRLKIGYNRAASIVEDMEAAGVVSAVQHNGSREVIAPPPVEL